jgi:hypothetical protein
MAVLLSKLFYFVVLISQKYNIDESHGLRHSMDVLRFTNEIYESQLHANPWLQDQERVIYVSAIIHDMCDKKYMNEKEGLQHIQEFLQDKLHDDEVASVKKIISTMSYSKVKKDGFPKFENLDLAYHIVREADLLTAYDFERCMVYNIRQQSGDITTAFKNANTLFNNRVFKHGHDGLFITDYSREKSRELHEDAVNRIATWKNIISKSVFVL